jgi:uncharacterized protein (DUF927 family)
LATGVGKLRSNIKLGVADTLTWANCFITSGETPIIADSDGAGAFGRVIEIECKGDKKIIADGLRTSTILKNNYGFAGQVFIKKIREMEVGELQKRYEKISKEMLKVDTDSKQALSASVLLLADELATEWIFKDGHGLKFNEVSEVLKSKASSSVGDRAYLFLCDWVVINDNRFRINENGENYGFTTTTYAYIIPTIFNKVLSESGFNFKSVLSQLKNKNLIDSDYNRFTKVARIAGGTMRYIALKLPQYKENDANSVDLEDL